jgi:hypothetical protein
VLSKSTLQRINHSEEAPEILFSTMKPHAYKSVALLAITASLGEGRQWQSVIDHAIYSRSNIDKERFSLTIEMDPLFFGDELPLEAPTPAPQAKLQAWVTLTPTETPSSIPSDFPSLAPTGPTGEPSTREQNIDGNGGCNEGTMLYQVNMYDSWGDGWDATMLKIVGIEDEVPDDMHANIITRSHTANTGNATVTVTNTIEFNTEHMFSQGESTPVDPLGLVFQAGLRRGSHAAADVCLMPRRCYEVAVGGGDRLEEVSWDIRPVNLGSDEQNSIALLEGGAPADCQFSVPDQNGNTFCPSTCDRTKTEPPMASENPEEGVSETTTGSATSITRDAGNGGSLLDYLRHANGNGQ